MNRYSLVFRHQQLPLRCQLLRYIEYLYVEWDLERHKELRRKEARVILPMLRRTLPKVIAAEIVGVQPLSSPFPDYSDLSEEKQDAIKAMQIKYNIPIKGPK